MPSDNVFAALVLRQVQIRKKAAGLHQRHIKSTAPSSDIGESQKLLGNSQWTNFIHESAAAFAPVVDRAAENSVVLDMRKGHTIRPKSQQRTQADVDLLALGPWDRMVHERRLRAKEEKVAKRAAREEAVLETKDFSDSDSAEVPPSAPPEREQPPPPPMPSHLQHAWRERDKQKRARRENLFQQEQQQRTLEKEALRREQEEEERAWKERQRRPCSQSARPEDRKTEHSPGPEETSNLASDRTPLSSGAWRPWHFPLFARRSSGGKYEEPSRRRSWVRGWRWGNARVTPESESGPCGEEGADVQEDLVVEHSSDDLIAEIEDELDRSRGQPLQERRRIFRELQRRLHPDKNPTNQESSKFAFQYLMDSRQSYLR